MMAAFQEHVLECDPEIFRRDLNILPYEIQHTLAGHPLFQLPALVGLAQRVATRNNPHMSGGDVYFNEGAIEAGAKPVYTGSAADRPDAERSRVAEVVRKIESAEAWIILKHVEREDGYREVMETAVVDALKLAGDDGRHLLRKIKWFEAIIFITSPQRVTEYHIDRECSLGSSRSAATSPSISSIARIKTSCQRKSWSASTPSITTRAAISRSLKIAHWSMT